MSGHSKWSKVKHQKATTDVVKAKAFTKAARAITVSVSEGGGITDPQGNFKLRLSIEQARAVNMPKENIERAIAKAKGENGEVMESLVYEAYGPEGVALIIEAASENRQRTVSAVKNVLDRHGGVLAAQGAVMYQFSKIGLIILEKKTNQNEDEILSLALEAGAEDALMFDDSIEMYVVIPELSRVKDYVTSKGYSVISAEIIYRPTMPMSVPEEVNSHVDTLIDFLQDLDDVQNVHSNIA